MTKALIAGINQVATDKGLDREVIFEAIEAALISAYKRNYGSVANVSAEVDRLTGDMRVFAEREVVEDVFNERTEIALADAGKLVKDVELGDVIKVETLPADFGRIAAQTAKQVILQRIREAERDTVYENFAHRVGELINSQVRSVDTTSQAVTVLLDEKHESLLMREEQIPGERLRRGDYLKVYVVDVHRSTRGPVIKLSRTHRNLLRRLMEQEIPEVRDGVVEIKAIAREPGARSKVAVVATQDGVDAVGSCVGMRGLRIQNIVTELANEKIDVVEWNNDLATYIANALSPAKVNNVILDDSNSIKTAVVVVPDRQLSLAIGKEGQNARLAAKLTGWRIDIKSESEAVDEGLDRLSQAQAQALSTPPILGDDLMARAEQFLRGGEDDEEVVAKPLGEDALSQAARALGEMGAGTSETAEGMSFDLPSFDDVLAQTDTDFSLPAEMPELPVFDDLPEIPALPDEDAAMLASESEEAAVEVEPAAEAEDEESMLSGKDLPEVITADMLRARMAQRRDIDFSDEDFEIPAELLVGLDEDEEVDEDWELSDDKPTKRAKSSKVGKTEKKPAKKRKKQRPSGDDDFDNFY
jgi:N utilization substance protein A